MPAILNSSSLLTTGIMDINQLGINDSTGVTSGPLVSIFKMIPVFGLYNWINKVLFK